jgi:hypothetical protein
MTFLPSTVGFNPFDPYTINIMHDTGHGNLVCRVECSFNADGYGNEDVEPAFQAILDHMATLPGFTVIAASRNAIGYQEISVT